VTAARSAAIAAASAGALEWLATVRTPVASGGAQAKLRAVVICAVCRDLATRHERRARSLAREFLRMLDHAPLAALLPCGGALLLLAYLAATRLALPAAGLARYARAAADVLREFRPGSADGDLIASATLLWHLKLIDKQPRMPRVNTDARVFTGAGKPAARAAIGALEAATAFGTARVSVSDALADALDGAAMAGLQDYDLDFACQALRARAYVSNRRGLAAQTALRFLLSNQDFDGSFGFFDDAMARKVRGIDPRLELRMPVTLACLWTIAEMGLAGYRLFRDLGA
jgi:hypothetical protein